MFDIFKNVISSKLYELVDILVKIDTVWVQGGITEDERTELIALARENANVSNSIDFEAKLIELDRRVTTFEAKLIELDRRVTAPDDAQNGADNEADNGTEQTYPEYVVGKWYYAGDGVLFDGVAYVCVAPEGVVCTWSPSEYPAYWKLVNE